MRWELEARSVPHSRARPSVTAPSGGDGNASTEVLTGEVMHENLLQMHTHASYL